MTEQWFAPWATAGAFTYGVIAFEWALLLAAAAFAGHLVQRLTGLPKVIGYAIVGALASWGGLANVVWPLHGSGLFLLELGIAVVLFEAGARLPLRWFRHNPLVLLQSVAESVLTFAATYVVLRELGLDVKVVHALAVIAVAASPMVLMRVVVELRAGGPMTDRAIALATLNNLYALTLGTAMLRTIGGGDATLLASVAVSLTVFVLSALAGALLAALLFAALRILQPTNQDTAIVILASIAACTAGAARLGASAALAALLGGLMLKQISARPWVWSGQFGTTATILTIAILVLTSAMTVQEGWRLDVVGVVLALIAVRAGTKVASLLVTSFGTGMAPRQALWAGVCLVPMSSVSLLLTSQFVSASHSIGSLGIGSLGIGSQVAAIALPVILVTEVLGAIAVHVALTRSGEITASPRQRHQGADAGIGETRE